MTLNLEPKYLGNVILTQNSDSKYYIIDGQQRITTLTMILSYIKKLHGNHIEVISPCKLTVESFSCFSDILETNFPEDKKSDPIVIDSDKLHQIESYYKLWSFIGDQSAITDRRSAQKILDNLYQSEFNIILNQSPELRDSIRYFIDVNLKGKQLDTEDIFKSYLFKYDTSPEIRKAWYELKTNVANSNINYPLLKFLEHYFYCDLYKDIKYKGLEFGEDFLLKKEFRRYERDPQPFRIGAHLIEVIESKQYMLNSIIRLNQAIKVMLCITSSSSTTRDFDDLFKCHKPSGKPDTITHDELKVIHNITCKVLKDNKTLPKALVMKYILTILLKQQPTTKSEYRKIYGVYLLAIFFVIFENKKSKDILLNILKADDSSWYREAIVQIKSYFSPDKITDTRILTQYKLAINETEEDYRFRCKSLATIYNFFIIKDDQVNIRQNKLSKLNKFITDSSDYSMEHFIISDSPSCKTKVIFNGEELEYVYNNAFFKKHVNNLFNFIFIPQTMNESLSNFWLPEKLKMIDYDKINCDYSKMLIKEVQFLNNSLEDAIKSKANYDKDLLIFFTFTFTDLYVAFARSVLKQVIHKIKTE